MKNKRIVWLLLRRNISAGQIAGYALANFIGLAIVLCAIQFYRDISAAWDSDGDSYITRDYMIISKEVSSLNTLGFGASTTFSKDEVEEISRQPWAMRVGEFSSSDFNVYASIELGGRGMSTYLFFESIPDEFFDVKPDGLFFDPENPVIPIILSKDYLALYNFGFAASRGMPQLSEGLISKVPLRIRMGNNGNYETYSARIVGFSSRLNTIAVPAGFLEWANARYAPGETHEPSRIMVEVNRPGDPAISEFLYSHGYESAGDKAESGKASFFLTLVTGIVIAVGAVISLLAFFILMLSIYLLLQKNRRKLHDLMLLGYSPMQVSRYYYALVGAVNTAVLLLAVATMLSASYWWSTRLDAIEVHSSGIWLTVIVGTVMMLLVTAGNFAAIYSTVKRNFRN